MSARYSRYQGSQVREGMIEMLIANPGMFDKMPGVTPEQREAYESGRQRMQSLAASREVHK